MTFDISNGLVQVVSTDMSLAGTTETVSVQVSLTDYTSVIEIINIDVEFICTVTTEEFVWTIDASADMEFVIRDYLASPVVYAPLVLAPLSSPPFYDDSSCALVAPIKYYIRY